MYLTVEEAREVPCPFKTKLCDLCPMAWRWAGFVEATLAMPDRSSYTVHLHERNNCVRVGYCGACGRPG